VSEIPCGFCQRPGRSDEHIFALWISDLLGARHPDNTVRHTLTRDEITTPPWYGGAINQIVRMPCKSCNGGWMSDIESYVSPIIGPMILDQGPVTLGVPSQVMMARWAIKIAMVTEYIRPARARYFSQQERSEFMNGGMPSGATVWIGRYGEENPGVQNSAAGLFTRPDRRIDGYVMTFAVGKLAVQIFVERSTPGHPVSVHPGPWNELLLEIWPPLLECSVTGAAVVWPPSLTADAGLFNALFHRFSLGA